MNDNLRDAAFRAGVWQMLEQKAKAMKDAAKAELSALEPGDRVTGKWHGQPVASATMSNGHSKLVIDDYAGFAQWVASRWPTEVVLQQTVNTAFINVLEKSALRDGALIDEQGDVCPFAEIVESSPYISVRKVDGAEEIIAELFRSGAVHLEGIRSTPLPALPEPTDRYSQDRAV